MRFSDIANPTVRCGAAVIYPTVRFGAVLKNRKPYGAVRCCDTSYILRCGSVRFSEIRNPTVRLGAIFRYRKSYGAVRCCDISYGAVRRGSPLNVFFYCAASLSVGKTVQHRFSPRCTV